MKALQLLFKWASSAPPCGSPWKLRFCVEKQLSAWIMLGNGIAIEQRLTLYLSDPVLDEATIRVSNISQNLALNCVGLVYDRQNHNFVKTPDVRPFIKARDDVEMELGSVRYGLDELLKELHRQLSLLDINDLRTRLNDIVKLEAKRSIVSLIVHSSLQEPYIWFRTFETYEGTIKFKASAYAGHPIPVLRARV